MDTPRPSAAIGWLAALVLALNACSGAGGGGGGAAPLPPLGSACTIAGQETCGATQAAASTRMVCTAGAWTLISACPAGTWCQTVHNPATGLQGTACGGADGGVVDVGATDGGGSLSDVTQMQDAGASGGCAKPSDCDDGDPCTADTCQAGQCGHAPVAGCGLAFPPCGIGLEQGSPQDDKACPAGMHCRMTTHMCVPCLNDKHCDGGQRCLDDLCVDGGLSCSGDAHCKGSNQVCDTKTGFCVDCVTPADCAAGQVCADRKCATACATSKDCPVVCDKKKGACVQCVAHGDCGAGTWCSARGQCEKPRCEGNACASLPGKGMMGEDVLAQYTCVDNGAAWKLLDVCGAEADLCAVPTCDGVKGCGTAPAPQGTKCGSYKSCDASGTCGCDNPKKQWPGCYLCKDPNLTGSTCEQCKDPSKKAPDCVLCANEQMTGADCDICIGQSKCNKCAAQSSDNCVPLCAQKACQKIVDGCLNNNACDKVWGCFDDCNKGKAPPGDPKGDTCAAKCISAYDDAQFSGTTGYADVNICLNAWCVTCPADKKSVCVGACGQMLCPAEKAACDASQSCRALRACAYGCATQSCLNACEKNSVGDGVALLNKWFACGETHSAKCM